MPKSVSEDEHIEAVTRAVVEEIEKRIPTTDCGHDQCQTVLTATFRVSVALSIMSMQFARYAGTMDLSSENDVIEHAQMWAREAVSTIKKTSAKVTKIVKKRNGNDRPPKFTVRQQGPSSIQ